MTYGPRTRRGRMVAAAAGLPLILAGLAGCGGEEAKATAAAPDPTLVYPTALTVCTDTPYKPFEFQRNGMDVGFDIDVAQKIADRLKVRIDVVDVDFDAITSGEVLNNGTCDMAISAMTITGERARVVDFSSNYFNAAQSLLVDPGSGIGEVGDLGGKRVAVQEQTTADGLLVSVAPSSTEIVRLKDLSAIRAAMSDGSVDAAMVDNGVTTSLLRGSSFEVVEEVETGEQYGIAVKKDGNADLLRVINDVLAEMRGDGSYDEIYKKWFGAKSGS
ncbi:MAG: ABC transporter substrate-binding protein [Nocardioides sp.]|uniref:ABC transporter substrate-binding protein n=1 Tax=Nocardioides sp. TaxID=35761 RepID=UPI003F09A8A5